jgi:hypothetical protein
VWACAGTLPHSVTPVAFISTEDQTAGAITCHQVDPQELGKGIRWGVKLGELLDELLVL